MTVNYRKIYEEATGVPIPKEFEIHHIDGDKKNNDITNLVALPKELHQEYHSKKNKLPANGVLDITLNIASNGSAYNSFLQTIFVEFHEVKLYCDEWYMYKEYLLKELPLLNPFLHEQYQGGL